MVWSYIPNLRSFSSPPQALTSRAFICPRAQFDLSQNTWTPLPLSPGLLTSKMPGHGSALSPKWPTMAGSPISWPHSDHCSVKKTAFDWTPELEAAFQHSRAAIVQEIRDGVEIFDLKRKTCLTPDWSKQGIEYWLRQKHCECDSVIPGCCPTGWRVTLAGSRFLRDAEQRYAPIEGEALAVAWALEDTKFFTLGCKDLVVATDHKPLVKILGDRCLGDIDNMRIFRLKQRTLKWRFQIVHIPGHLIPASDATSRHPAGAQQFDDPAHVLAILRVDLPDSFSVDGMLLASASAGIGSLGTVTWLRVRTATQNDNDLVQLRGMIESGFPESRDQLPENLQPYWQHRNDLYVTDGVIMKGHRILIPPVLRPRSLKYCMQPTRARHAWQAEPRHLCSSRALLWILTMSGAGA